MPIVAKHRAKALWPAAYVASYFLLCGICAFVLGGRDVGNLIFLWLIGAFVFVGFLIHARTRKTRRDWGRKVSVVAVGSALFLGAGVFGRQNFQLEGFLFHLMLGVSGGAITHYLVAKVLGPLLIGRAFCSWGCWVWMVFDQLPWHRSPHRPSGKLPWLRVAHFALSAALVASLIGVAHYRPGFEWKHTQAIEWFLFGSLGYFALGIPLAAVRKDNRAFCKLLCPVTVLNRAGGRFSLLKVGADRAACNDCGACDELCPMDVPISTYVLNGTRVLDKECTLCQRCIAVCPKNALGLSLGFDVSRARPESRSARSRSALSSHRHA